MSIPNYKLVKRLRDLRVLNLSTRLAAAVVVIVGLTSLLVHVLWLTASNYNVRLVIGQTHDAIVQETTREVGALFGHVQSVQQLIALSLNQGLINLDNPDQRQVFLLNLLQAHPTFTWVQFGYANGDYAGAQRVILGDRREHLKFHFRDWNEHQQWSSKTTDTYEPMGWNRRWLSQKTIRESLPYFAPQRPWYQDAVRDPGQQTWTVYLYRTTNTPGIDSSITYSRDGQIVGVIGIGFELNHISRYLARQQRLRPGDVFIVNARDELIATSDLWESSPEQSVGADQARLKRLSDVRNPRIQLAVHTLQQHRQSIATIRQLQQYLVRSPRSGRQYYVSFNRLPYLDWVMGTVIPISAYAAAIERNQVHLTLALVGFSVLMSIAAIHIANRTIARPIWTVAKATNAVAVGEPVTNLEAIARRSDELGQLARLFSTMAHQLYRRGQEQQRAEQALQTLNQQLEEHIHQRTQELEASLGEKEVLIKEIHHRVKNNLQTIISLLNLQSDSITDPVLLEHFNTSRNRIYAMAAIHEKLYQANDLSQINFASYVHTLTVELIASYRTPSQTIELDADIPEINLNVDVAIPCGLVINELVSNALKHAFPHGTSGRIHVHFTATPNQHYVLQVMDNGVGFPRHLNIQEMPSLGLQLVQAFVCKLHGDLELRHLEDNGGHGTAFIMRFPIPTATQS